MSRNRVSHSPGMAGQGQGDGWGEAGQNQEGLSVPSGPLNLFYDNNLS